MSNTSDEDVLSILNVVADYVMVKPTPLEPDEFSWELQRNLRRGKMYESDNESDQYEDVQVPVLRIFGPITRPSCAAASQSQSSPTHCATAIDNKTNSDNIERIMNRQSGCLYIHGAYPYLLARPVTAGIDGSPFTYNKDSKRCDDNETYIDWDDHESVKAITTELHISIEEALKAYFDTESLRTVQKNLMTSRTTGQPSTTLDESSVAKASVRFIRSISIAMGRGFYSFSLGPPSPFIRVEYYNPKMRWIVKALLEQGLDVPLFLHPNPRQYEQDCGNTETIDGKLKFHCFEAHIPYTMQVFKDLNLSGMSPVHVRDCRFRTPLPRKRRARVVVHRDDEGLHNQSSSSFSHLFLKGHVNDSLLWQSVGNENPTTSCVDMNEFWSRRETSCDVEVDTTVQNISNVLQIIRPDDDNANDHTIHWRAVPSLREMWEEEKRRMEYLCSHAKEDYTEVFQFDGSSTSKSGARLALAGARRLFDSTPEIYVHYLKALKDIINLYAEEVGEEDQRFQDIAIKMDQVLENRKDFDEDNDILDTLRALAAQYSPARSSKADSHSKIDNVLTRSLTTSDGLTQRISSGKRPMKSSLDFHKLTSDVDFGSNVDRCDLVKDYLSLLQGPNDVILNPLTLTMERLIDDDDDSFENEEEFERSLCETGKSFPATDLAIKEPPSNNLYDLRLLDGSSFISTPAVGKNIPLSQRLRSNSPLFSKESSSSLIQRTIVKGKEENTESVDDAFQWDSEKKQSSSMNIHPSTIFDNYLRLGELKRIAQNEPLHSGSFDAVSEDRCLDHFKQNEYSWQQSSETASNKPLFRGSLFAMRNKAPNRSEVSKNSLGFSASSCRNNHALFANALVDEIGWASFLNGNNYDKLSYYAPTTGPPSNISVLQWQLRNPLCPIDKSARHVRYDYGVGNTSDISIQNSQNKNEISEGPGPNVAPSTSSSHSTSLDMKALSSSKAPTSGGICLMSIEIHVQCRIGKSSLNKAKEIALFPDPAQDPIFAIAYVYSLDPGNGERIQMVEQGCIFIPISKNTGASHVPLDDYRGDSEEKIILGTLGNSCKLNLEAVADERHLLLRFSSIVQVKDPDVLISWDTQCAGIGYIISRGEALRNINLANNQSPIDMIRLLGRTPRSRQSSDCAKNTSVDEETENSKITGSGLGADWDDRVGAGVLASSIIGRIPLCGWKILSEDVQHPNGSYQQAMVSSIMKKRMPFHDDFILTHWYAADGGIQRHRVIWYRIMQCFATTMLFDFLDVFGRAGEAARLSGVELSQSFPGIRGSQYKVEGVLLRALKSIGNAERGSKHGQRNAINISLQCHSARSKSQSQSPWKIRRVSSRNYHDDSSYFFFSPSRDDCKLQEALECQALTLEPQSGFHFDPIVVVDFQSLYPSLIIAYNLCYSTLAGKLDYHSTRPELCLRGRTTNHLGPLKYSERRSATVLAHHMKSLKNTSPNDHGSDRAYVFPTGSIFVTENVLKGVLPQILDEMLTTRSMLKKVAKEYRRRFPEVTPAVLRMLEARQLALKYVANVTYGYTSATFSGRCAMPILADTIVECGRRTLTNAINLASKWAQDPEHIWHGCEVVYGDTDSIFLKLPGRSIKEAFAFGEDFCRAITNANPPPVHLKLEKVYAVSLLQTKKKYCGLKYESPDQVKPIFEAKGIETVRRDQCQLTQNVLRNALMILFCGGSIEHVKVYLYRQWAMIHAGRRPMSEFILTGRVRSEYRGGKIGPVQSALARRLAESDPVRRILHKERLPYVIAALPGHTFKLRDCVLTPNELLEHWDAFTIHSGYYITRHVNAALKRCFSLAPFYCDIDSWYEASPKVAKSIHCWPSSKSGHGSMISFFFGSDTCAICNVKCHANAVERVAVCDTCKDSSSDSSFMAFHQLNSIQQKSNKLAYICHECNGCLENSGTYAREKHVLVRKIRSDKSKCTTNLMVDGIQSPISNCTCIDCEISYMRHELREREIETLALCRALRLYK